jgi:hypothetical protein
LSVLSDQLSVRARTCSGRGEMRGSLHSPFDFAQGSVEMTDSWVGLGVIVSSYQLSAISYQLSAIGYRLSAIGCQLSAVSFQVFGRRHTPGAKARLLLQIVLRPKAEALGYPEAKAGLIM